MLKSIQISKKVVSIIISLIIALSVSFVLPAQTTTADAASKKTKVIRQLTQKKWILSEAYCDGEPYNPGSIVSMFGAYCQFKKNKTFRCVVGFEGASGKYSVSKKGKVTLHIKRQWGGTGNIKVRTKKTTLKISKSYKTISFSIRHNYSLMKYYFQK